MLQVESYRRFLRDTACGPNPMQTLKREIDNLVGANDPQELLAALESLQRELSASILSRFYAVFGEYLKARLDIPLALKAYTQALDHQDYFYARLGLIECLAVQRRADEVVNSISLITLKRLPNAGSAAHLMLAAARVGAFNLCDQIFADCSVLFPNSYDLYYVLAKCAFVKGNPVAARAIALKYLATSSESLERKERMRREFAMDDDYVEFSYGGRSFTMIYPEFASQAHRRARSCFGELEILEFLRDQRPDHKTIIDVGCHVGNHSRYFQSFLKHNSIIGFDAARNAGMYYCRNVPGAIFYNVPVGRSGEEIELYGDIINSRFGQAGVVQGNQILRPEARLVKTNSLDEFAFRDVTMIKIDVEGWELAVLEGAMQTINSQKPILLFEVFRDNRARYEEFISTRLPGYRVTRSFGDQSWKKHDILIEYAAS